MLATTAEISVKDFLIDPLMSLNEAAAEIEYESGMSLSNRHTQEFNDLYFPYDRSVEESAKIIVGKRKKAGKIILSFNNGRLEIL